MSADPSTEPPRNMEGQRWDIHTYPECSDPVDAGDLVIPEHILRPRIRPDSGVFETDGPQTRMRGVVHDIEQPVPDPVLGADARRPLCDEFGVLVHAADHILGAGLYDVDVAVAVERTDVVGRNLKPLPLPPTPRPMM